MAKDSVTTFSRLVRINAVSVPRSDDVLDLLFRVIDQCPSHFLPDQDRLTSGTSQTGKLVMQDRRGSCNFW